MDPESQLPDRCRIAAPPSPDEKSFIFPLPAHVTTAMTDSQSTPSHSRESSAGSSHIPGSPRFSAASSRTHSRWPSSSSSLATNPDSPVNVAKSPLHDLLEEPSERDDELEFAWEAEVLDRPLCLCDSVFCEHQQIRSVPGTRKTSLSLSRGTGDESKSTSSDKRLSAEAIDEDNLQIPSRLSRRFASVSRRWRARSLSKPVLDTGIRSAPLSRTSSYKHLSLKQFISTGPDSGLGSIACASPTTMYPECFDSFASPAATGDTTPSAHEEPADADQPPMQELERSPTPLLPPLPSEQNQFRDGERSPLYPPLSAGLTASESIFSSPVSSPTSPNVWSPALSTMPSSVSLRARFSHNNTRSIEEFPPLSISGELDHWALQLGHANFHILPEPYLPDPSSSSDTTPPTAICKRLLEDWESARIEFLRHASRVAEHHGPTSRIYNLTCSKWKEVDAQWRANFDLTRAGLEPSSSTDVGDTSDLRPLPELQPCLHMPSLPQDPENPAKFPALEEGEIVGPMVQHARVEAALPATGMAGALSRRPTLLRLLTDAASLLRRG